MKKQTAHVKTEIQHVESWAGPLPSPEALVKYNEAAPGAADRIISMAEKEMEHRHKLEDKAIKASTRLAMVSVIFGFCSVVVLSSLVGYAIHRGNTGLAFGAIIGAIAAVAGLFTYGKVKQAKNSE